MKKPLAALSSDYMKYGLKEGNVPEIWEDGMRTTGQSGTYEWWYFDAHLEDGSTVVIVFLTKHFHEIDKDLSPMITINIDRPNGDKIEKRIEFDPSHFSSSSETCDIQIGPNYFRGNLEEYEIHFEDYELNFTAKVKRTTQSWRPKTGHIEFGKDHSDYFAWVVPIPNGEVDCKWTYRGTTSQLSGSCYHDHNWGNRMITELFNHWYWSRSKVGPYTIIASEMIAEQEFGKESIVVFNISKDGETIADNEKFVKAYRTYGNLHPTLLKDISDHISFQYNDPQSGIEYEYNLHKENIIIEEDILESTTGSKNFKYFLARLVTGFDGAYFRFTGKAELKIIKDNTSVENHSSSKAIWELMYFGKTQYF